MIKSLTMFILVFFISVVLTGLIRNYALQKKILDIPNDRSSHHIPIARGGGIVFVLLFSLLSAWLTLIHWIPLEIFYALSGGFVIATIGWLDDLVSIHPIVRGITHLVVAIWAVYWIGGLSSFKSIVIAYPLAVIGIAWSINLYNFMDGIDGLAGAEGLFISLSTAVAFGLLGILGMGLLCLLLGGTIAGFLTWNWPPAKIFMGDVGSGYLGYIFAVLAIATANFGMIPLTFWIIVSAVFLCDASLTVLYRIYHRERWYLAHRKHAYQRLVQRWLDHKTVTMSVIFINVFILFPLAFSVLYYPTWHVTILSAVFFILFFLWVFIVARYRVEGGI